ncbi:MAG: hypothetical protein HW391_1780 [Chloroflexi bacterium]|nr:hypothetical protein [Chloroflexota bacterium]
MTAPSVRVTARPRSLTRIAPAWLLLAAALVVALAACGGAASSTPSTSPDPSPASPLPPTSEPTVGEIAHATGTTDVVFRFEEGGGIVPIDFFATYAPMFTIYGDGTVIFRDLFAALPSNADGLARLSPFLTVKLTEVELQAFLRYAIGDGGLSVARGHYDGPGADLPTSTFTLTAAGTTKVVSVFAIGMERPDSVDSPVLQGLARLGERIRAFSSEVQGEVAWVPDRWRGVLTPDSLNPPRAWPWPAIVPADFAQRQEPNAPGFPVRTMSLDEVSLLGLEDIDGGFSSLTLAGPDGKAYSFALRPLLPDDQY